MAPPVCSGRCSVCPSLLQVKTMYSLYLPLLVLCLQDAQSAGGVLALHYSGNTSDREGEQRVYDKYDNIFTSQSKEQAKAKTCEEMFLPNNKLQWVPGENRLIPLHAVSIENSYTTRKDYVCRPKDFCSSGFFSIAKGPYCHYPYYGEEHHTENFEFLVNPGDLEMLEWKSRSDTTDYQNTVKVCQDGYVGNNRYGVGFVISNRFYLPYDGKEYSYKDYNVLTIKTEKYHLDMSEIKYRMDCAKKASHPPQNLKISKVINNNNEEVNKKVTMEETIQKTSSWDTGTSTKLAISSTVSAGIPKITQASLSVSVEETKSLSQGTSVSESQKHSLSVEVHVPPRHSCIVRMEGRKFTAEIPFTAQLTRRYTSGKISHSTISGVYKGVDMGEIHCVVDQCESLQLMSPGSSHRSNSAWLTVTLLTVCVASLTALAFTTFFS
uniref:Natterin-3-like n=1 Tax=Scleropages formosus TaxID=113540 RepID=A0A8C9RHK0_SCLFO